MAYQHHEVNLAQPDDKDISAVVVLVAAGLSWVEARYLHGWCVFLW